MLWTADCMANARKLAENRVKIVPGVQQLSCKVGF
eukprot:SAG11_NODE_2575_length_3206_cov_1.588993_1_plen_34_part_10